MFTWGSSHSMYGYVSLIDVSSSSSASHFTNDLTSWQPGWTLTSPRYEVRPPAFEIDLDVIVEVVLGAACTILPPASWCCPLPANATLSTSPLAPGSIRKTEGYFIVICEPRLPSTHSMVA